MKKLLIIGLLLLGLDAKQASNSSKKYENTICFTYIVGDSTELEGGSCDKKSIKAMNQEGWKVVQIITGTNKIGVLFERELKSKK